MSNSMKKNVTFETKCYENDWKYILKTSYLEKLFFNNKYDFAFKQLIINNVKNREEVEKYAKIKVKNKIIDAYYFTEDTENEVLDFFKINKQSFNGGFYYSISELTGIYKCSTKYLLHFSSDAFPYKNTNLKEWIDSFIKNNNENNNYIISTLIWNNKINEVIKESANHIPNFYIAQGFSDQCYLIEVNEFKKDIYNENNYFSNRYPKYGGELFEKRVDAYMRNHDKIRLISDKYAYVHENFPKKGIKKLIFNFFCYTNLFLFTRFIRGNYREE